MSQTTDILDTFVSTNKARLPKSSPFDEEDDEYMKQNGIRYKYAYNPKREHSIKNFSELAEKIVKTHRNSIRRKLKVLDSKLPWTQPKRSVFLNNEKNTANHFMRETGKSIRPRSRTGSRTGSVVNVPMFLDDSVDLSKQPHVIKQSQNLLQKTENNPNPPLSTRIRRTVRPVVIARRVRSATSMNQTVKREEMNDGQHILLNRKGSHSAPAHRSNLTLLKKKMLHHNPSDSMHKISNDLSSSSNISKKLTFNENQTIAPSKIDIQAPEVVQKVQNVNKKQSSYTNLHKRRLILQKKNQEQIESHPVEKLSKRMLLVGNALGRVEEKNENEKNNESDIEEEIPNENANQPKSNFYLNDLRNSKNRSSYQLPKKSSSSSISKNEIQDETLETDMTEQLDLVQCSDCGRKFAKDRIEKHKKICKKVFGTQRKKFDAKKQIIPKEALSVKQTSTNQIPKPKSKWKQKSEAFRNALAAARIKSGKVPDELQEMQRKLAEELDDRIACPHCGRKFSETAARRHIPVCSQIKHKPTTLRRRTGRAAGYKPPKK